MGKSAQIEQDRLIQSEKEFRTSCFPPKEPPEKEVVEFERKQCETNFLFQLAVALLLFLPLTMSLSVPVSTFFLFSILGMIFSFLKYSSRLKREFFFRTYIVDQSSLNRFNRMRFWHYVIFGSISFFFSVFTFAGVFINGFHHAIFMIFGLVLGSKFSDCITVFLDKHIKPVALPRFRHWVSFSSMLVSVILYSFLGVFVLANEIVRDMSPMQKADVANEIVHPVKWLQDLARSMKYIHLSVAPVIESFAGGWILKIWYALPNLLVITGVTLAFQGIKRFFQPIWGHFRKNFAQLKVA